MFIRRLKFLFNIDEVIYFEGKLYERLYGSEQKRLSLKNFPYKYRVILAEDDYDYVVIPALRKRLDRAFKRASK